MVAPATTLSVVTGDELRAHLLRRVYQPGWTLTVHDSPWEGPWLCVRTDVTNSYRPNESTLLDIHAAIPPMDTVEQFDRWLVWRLTVVASHEVREWFRDTSTGRPVFDPHDEHANVDHRTTQ